MRGFIVGDHGDREPAFREEVGDLVRRAAGCVPAESIVDGGIEAAAQAFVAMLRGEYVGKVVVRLVAVPLSSPTTARAPRARGSASRR